MEKVFKVEGMRCEHCSARVEKALKAQGYEVKVKLDGGEVTVSADTVNADEVKNTIEDLGFIVK